MAQSYLIFSQGGMIEITQHPASDSVLLSNGKEEIICEKDFSHFVLPRIIELESGKLNSLQIKTPFALRAFEMLKTCYDQFIVAAGGLVQNEKGELLLIFRNGKWDLPKGKLEENEHTDAAALREVREETGLKKLQLLSEYQRTYHTYTQNGKRILKETAWYLMQGASEATAPQTEEGITHIEWVAADNAQEVLGNTYDNILLLIQSYFKTT